MTIYKNFNIFQIVDFSPTHNQLLLRSLKTRERDYNIDVILKGVNCLIFPTTISGIQISALSNVEQIKFLKKKFCFNTKYDYRIFLIINNQGDQYFVNAMCFGIYHNKLGILESSLGRYDTEDFGELQKWYAE